MTKIMISEDVFQDFVMGREKAWEIVFRQYYKTLVSFVMRHGLEQMKAEDIVVEVFYKIWNDKIPIKSPSHLNNLLYVSVRNRALNAMRNIKNRQEILDSVDYFEEEVTSDLFVEEEVGRNLYTAVQLLPSKCREVIMATLEGKENSEIAKQMNISVSTVKNHKARAIEILRLHMCGN